uniref:Paired amphipathic helix protein Sin3-like 2 isoform X1 n=1 Tax=Tanacetum cinerariifolium TaxID=118510 RepID=A0A6L2JSA2_TANCI|nr:paired amphipathic helix protein Sin3-like 2 isoform X1 [Tanacetum cinerariifolium]
MFWWAEVLYDRLLSAKLFLLYAEARRRTAKDSSPSDLYIIFMNSLYNLLDGVADNLKFEDDCRDILGNQSLRQTVATSGLLPLLLFCNDEDDYHVFKVDVMGSGCLGVWVDVSMGSEVMVRMTVVFLRLMLRVLAILVSGLMFLWALKLFQDPIFDDTVYTLKRDNARSSSISVIGSMLTSFDV